MQKIHFILHKGKVDLSHFYSEKWNLQTWQDGHVLHLSHLSNTFSKSLSRYFQLVIKDKERGAAHLGIWKRIRQEERKEAGKTCFEISRPAKDRIGWRPLLTPYPPLEVQKTW